MSIDIAFSIFLLVNLTNRYCYQLLNGCNCDECRQSLCATGQRNLAPPGRPVRRWSPRSARAIALSLAERNAPAAHLCLFCPKLHRLMESTDTIEQPETPRDNSSLMQQLCDTNAIRTIFSGDAETRLKSIEASHPKLFDDLAEMHKLHTQLDALQYGTTRQNIAAVELAECFRMVIGETDHLKEGDIAPLVDAAYLTSKGRALPDRRRRRSPEHMKTLLSFLDELQDEPTNRFAKKVFSTLYHWTCAEEQAGLFQHEYFPRQLLECRLVEDFALAVAEMYRIPSILTIVAAWTQRVILKHWGNQPLITEPVAIAALQFLHALWNYRGVSMNKMMDRSKLLRAVPRTLDDIEVAKTWLSPPGPGRHVLSFPMLFTNTERTKYFRIINTLRMQDAYSKVEVNIRFRANMQRYLPDREPLPAAITWGERHYLLLNVSRDEVLKDAHDQLWQRRQGELVRPLRVRLGELEQLEIGQDLGGVQIEFFNLICERMFSEEAGMFTALDSTTGLHYFRFGSLQPLYMFELSGLLIALAMFNGITLPVSLPRAFYQRILRPSMQMPKDMDDTLELLQHGWPAETRSMEALLTARKPEDFEQDYVFPFDANGLRGSALLPEVTGDVCMLRIIDSSPAVEESTIVAEWHGWIVVGPEPDQPDPKIIDKSNRHQYVRDYVNWVTYLSVKPQWDAFAAGFSRIFDDNFGRKNQGPLAVRPSLDTAYGGQPLHLGAGCRDRRKDLALFDADGLRFYVEGTSRLDVVELRRATKYKGYDPGSTYIGFFWDIVSNWTPEMQKQLLKFVTAVERMPIGGASSVTFMIQRVDLGSAGGADNADLPTSSTCFGTLMLPVYASRDLLEKKLSLAVELGCQGFGTG